MQFINHKFLYGNLAFDVRMGIITRQVEILVPESEYVFYVWVDFHPGKRPWVTCQLQLHLFKMVRIDMCIAKRMDKISGFQPGYLCHHL